VVGKRVYWVVVGGRRGRANELEWKGDFEKVAMGFINSFKLNPESAKPDKAGMHTTTIRPASHRKLVRIEVVLAAAVGGR